MCRQFIVLCRRLDLFTQALVAIDGSKFKAVNNRDKNFTAAKLKRRVAEIDASIAGYLAALDSADQAGSGPPEEGPPARQDRGIEGTDARAPGGRGQAAGQPRGAGVAHDPDARSMKNRDGGIVGYNVQAAVEAEHHLIVAHEVVTDGIDHNPLARWPSRRGRPPDRCTHRGGRPWLLQERADPPL